MPQNFTEYHGTLHNFAYEHKISYEELLKIEAVNVLRKAGKNITSKIKDDEALKKLVELIDGDIEVLSYELN